MTLVERVTDESDGFVTYQFRSPDGALTEAVRIPLEVRRAFAARARRAVVVKWGSE